MVPVLTFPGLTSFCDYCPELQDLAMVIFSRSVLLLFICIVLLQQSIWAFSVLSRPACSLTSFYLRAVINALLKRERRVKRYFLNTSFVPESSEARLLRTKELGAAAASGL